MRRLREYLENNHPVLFEFILTLVCVVAGIITMFVIYSLIQIGFCFIQ